MTDTSRSEAERRVAMRRAAIAVIVFAALTALLLLLAPDDAYNWIKALHIIAVIAWMAGMLYLPRLFVYHADSETGSQQSETFKVMERRLLRGIINPAMVMAWVLGLWLAWKGFGFQGGWLHVKLAAVVALSACHGYLSASVRRFARDENIKPARHWRLVNEIPTLLMVVIVIMVIVKPF